MQKYVMICVLTCFFCTVPSPPTVSITPFNNVTLAGQSLTLNCSASIQDGIRGTPTLMWTRVDDVLTIEATSEPPLLSFSSLRTSHAGRYTCTARLAISEAGVDVSGANTTGVSVQSTLQNQYYSHFILFTLIRSSSANAGDIWFS